MKKLLCLLIFAAVTLNGAVTAKTLNRTLGLQLFAENNSWDMADFVRRTRLRFSGNGGKYSTLYRKNFAGAPAREIHLQLDEHKRIKLITIQFSNRGDDRRKASSRIKDARKQISGRLNSLLGRSSRKSPDFSPVRAKMDKWQCRYADIYLEVDKGEFIMLHIQPHLPRLKNSPTRETDLSENLEKNSFGDVFIKNIPMVDQGGKGYCVPATLSRIFLYYGINLDMHHLAQRGDSDPDEGTFLDGMYKSVKSVRRQAGLNFSRFSKISVRDVSRHIDKGRPVLWAMHSTPELNKLYNFSRLNRRKFTDPAKWARELKKVSIPRRSTDHHVCLIIGYNEITDEIAITNSWGPAHIAPIWIPVKAAKKVTQNEMYVFYPR